MSGTSPLHEMNPELAYALHSALTIQAELTEKRDRLRSAVQSGDAELIAQRARELLGME
jgi:hypothetical protein